MTIIAIKLLKKFLDREKWNKEKKARVWLTACLCWAGSFRIHEILSKERKKFDKLTTWIGSRVQIGSSKIDNQAVESMVVFLKSPKEDKSGKGAYIEVFRNDSYMCPLQAWHQWRRWSPFPIKADKPIIREPSGVCYTGAAFQKDLKQLTDPFVSKLNRGTFSTHSFR